MTLLLPLLTVGVLALSSVGAQSSCFSTCQREYAKSVQRGGGASARCNGWRDFERCFVGCPGGARQLQSIKDEMREQFRELNSLCEGANPSYERGRTGASSDLGGLGSRGTSYNRIGGSTLGDTTRGGGTAYDKYRGGSTLGDSSYRRTTEISDYRRDHSSRDILRGGSSTRDFGLSREFGRDRYGTGGRTDALRGGFGKDRGLGSFTDRDASDAEQDYEQSEEEESAEYGGRTTDRDSYRARTTERPSSFDRDSWGSSRGHTTERPSSPDRDSWGSSGSATTEWPAPPPQEEYPTGPGTHSIDRFVKLDKVEPSPRRPSLEDEGGSGTTTRL